MDPSLPAGTSLSGRSCLSKDRYGPVTPRSFIWACEDDELVPVNNATLMDAALEQAGVPHLVKLYPTGSHGCGLGTGTSASGCSDEMLAFMA